MTILTKASHTTYAAAPISHEPRRKQRCSPPQWHLFFWSLLLLGSILLPSKALAGAGQACVSNIEPTLQSQAQGGLTGAGIDIIDAVFQSINTILGNMLMNFYTNVVGDPRYQAAVSAAVLLYLTIYGVLITLNMASAHTGEVTQRLIKIGLVWSALTGGWTFFNQWIGAPAIAAINDLIASFSQAAYSLSVTAVDTTSGNTLSPNVMGPLTSAMTLLFSAHFLVVLETLIFVGPQGWLFILLLLWGLFQFLLLLIAAVVSYVRGMVGLTFLFALFPLFFPMILFQKSKQVFLGWLNEALHFFLQPVLLFAFLSFFAVLLYNSLYNILFAYDYCYMTIFSVGFFNWNWWWPVPVGSSCITDPNHPCTATWSSSSNGAPFSILQVLYFLLLLHLGKNFCAVLQEIAQKISGGSSASSAMVKGEQVGQWFSNQLTGGRGVGGTIKAGGQKLGEAIGAGSQKIGGGISKLVAKRKGPKSEGTRQSSQQPSGPYT